MDLCRNNWYVCIYTLQCNKPIYTGISWLYIWIVFLIRNGEYLMRVRVCCCLLTSLGTNDATGVRMTLTHQLRRYQPLILSGSYFLEQNLFEVCCYFRSVKFQYTICFEYAKHQSPCRSKNTTNELELFISSRLS